MTEANGARGGACRSKPAASLVTCIGIEWYVHVRANQCSSNRATGPLSLLLAMMYRLDYALPATVIVAYHPASRDRTILEA